MSKDHEKIRIRCPNCYDQMGINDPLESEYSHCPHCNSQYPFINNHPVLISKKNEIFSLDSYYNPDNIKKGKPKTFNMLNIVFKNSTNLSVKRCLSCFIKRLNDKNPAYVLVIGCGEQRQYLYKHFGTYSSIKFIFYDVDISADVNYYCDAHELPFFDLSFDGVIATAVIEHVIRPEVVVGEIHRVLKKDGLVYSEIPFIQQVHEGAYDFTRHTIVGHRKLFNLFTEIDSGMVAGPGTSLLWSIEHFFLSFFHKRQIRFLTKILVRMVFFWIKYFDYWFVRKSYALEGASCTYFFGLKASGPISDLEIIRSYTGPS